MKQDWIAPTAIFILVALVMSFVWFIAEAPYEQSKQGQRVSRRTCLL